MPPKKRDLSGSPGGTTTKASKTEQRPDDFSNSVKKRLQGSTRTGQACDRCKIRKIRCDGLPGGCSPCLQNQTECRTTDRITGRAAPRGYVEGLENQVNQMQSQATDMRNRIQELEQLMMQHNIDIKPRDGFSESSNIANNQGYSFATSNGFNSASNSASFQPSSTPLPMANHDPSFRNQPILKTGFSGDQFLGVSTGNSHLSSIKGTALSILGMEIDIADFESTDMDEPEGNNAHGQLYNKSYHAFLMSTLNVNPRIEQVDLPPRDEGMMYAQWYLRALNPYLPLLHRPTFMKLLTRMYDDPTFKPTVAQTVIVHIVFAIMSFQIAMRNHEDAAQQARTNAQSNLHYHFCLGKFYQLSISHTFEDLQALTLICAHLRNFPKPGASWVLTNTTLGLAIELGLHRSVKSRPPNERMPNPLEIEIRKRTFWCLLAIHVGLSGKLGRPIHIRMDDFDVEFPEAVDDDLLSEVGLDTSRPGVCTFKIGIAALKLIPVLMEIYATIYAVRRNPETYIEMVKTIEGRLRHWISELPDDLLAGDGGADMAEGRVFALYTQTWVAETRMLLYHPSMSLTLDSAFNAESMKICVEAARNMQRAVVGLQKLKSLDTTWYQSAVYVMAITTTLFAQWEKRNEMTAKDLADLRSEMDVWLDVMGPVGQLLGSGTRLRDAVRNVTEGTLSLLNHTLLSKPDFGPPRISSSSQEVKIKTPPRRLGSVSSSSIANTNNNFQPVPYNNSPSRNNSTSATTFISQENNIPHQTPYPAATQYSSYTEHSPTPANPPFPAPAHHSSFSYPSGTNESSEAPLLAAFASQASQVPHAHTHTPDWQRPPSSHRHQSTPNSSQSWQQWTSAVTGNLEPQDCYSANALMQLGGRDLDAHQVGNMSIVNTSSAPMTDMSGAHAAVMAVAHLQGDGGMTGNGGIAWPLNIFDIPGGPQGQ